MGAWGTAVFSDDLAADLRSGFRELIGDGLSSTEATERLMEEYASSLQDQDEMPVFWIALASVQWTLGRLEERTKTIALKVIDDGTDLARWDDTTSRKKRSAVMTKTRQQLLSPQPPAKRIPRTIREANAWHVGEMIGFQLLSGAWTVFRVIGHHTDKGGRFAVCEILDWSQPHLPDVETIARLPFLAEAAPHGISRFIFVEPRKKAQQTRVVRMGISSPPMQECQYYTALAFPYIDAQIARLFGLR
jgi:hypothetical protein